MYLATVDCATVKPSLLPAPVAPKAGPMPAHRRFRLDDGHCLEDRRKLPKGRASPYREWKTFLRNHTDEIAAMDLFVVPTVSFRLLYGLLILRHCRREAAVARCDRPSERQNGSPGS